MKTLTLLATSLALLTTWTATAQTVSPAEDATIRTRVDAPYFASTTYTFTADPNFGTDYIIEWDPNAYSSFVRVNGEWNPPIFGYLEAGQTLDVTFEAFSPSSPGTDSGTLRIITNQQPMLEERQVSVEATWPEVTITPLQTGVVSLPHTPFGPSAVFRFTVTNDFPQPIEVDLPSDTSSVSYSPSRLFIGANSSGEALMFLNSWDYTFLGRYTESIYFIEPYSNSFVGGSGVTFDYGRYPMDTPLPLSDVGTFTSTLTLTEEVCLISRDPHSWEFPGEAEIGVELDLDHPDITQLTVTLESPTGQLVTLHNRDTFGGGTSIDQTFYYYDAHGPGDTRDFRGMFASGDWTLRVHSTGAGSVGQLNGWALLLPSGDDCNPLVDDLILEAVPQIPITFDLPIRANTDTVATVLTKPSTGLLIDPLDGPIFSVPFELSGTTLQYVSNDEAVVTFDYQVARTDGSDPDSGTGEITIAFPCLGDVNDDRTVDLNDLAIVLGNFGDTNASKQDGDLDGDGTVSLSDLAEVLGGFGQSC